MWDLTQRPPRGVYSADGSPVSMQSDGRGCDSSLPLKSLPTCFDHVTDRQKPKQVEYCRKYEMSLKPVNPWRIFFFFVGI